jgi:protease secretion system membrane fusion protein
MHPSESASSLPASSPTSEHALKVGRYALGLALLALLAWSLLAPIDEGIPASGAVTVDTKRKAVQHLQGGIVREVHVSEGGLVKEGQVLMVLEQGSTRANFESVRQHYLALRTTESRLLAERAGADSVSFHPDILEMQSDPLVRQHMQTQLQLFASRRQTLQISLKVLTENRAGLQEQRKGLVQVMAERQRQLSLLEEELGNLRELVREGFAPRNRQLEMERNRADIRSALAETSAAMQRLDRQMEEVVQRMQLTEQDYIKEVDTQTAEVRREVQADAEKLKAVTQDLARTELRAPVSGQVVGLGVQSVGAVVGPGQKIMDIVPEQAPLMIEARVSPQVIDRLKEGMPTEIRFSGFAQTPQLNVAGRVVSVSKDMLTDPDTRMPYFLARVEVTDQGRQTLGARQMQPGMMADVLIKTGERSFLAYLTYPLVRRLAQSMTEE